MTKSVQTDGNVYLVKDRDGCILRAFLDKALAEEHADQIRWRQGNSAAILVETCHLSLTLPSECLAV